MYKKNTKLYEFFLSCAFDTTIDTENPCVDLGESTQGEMIYIVDRHNEDKNYYIMGTITVPPKLILKNNNYSFSPYEQETQKNQKLILYLLTNKLVSMNPYFFIRNFNLNYELHKNGNIHAHFIAEINEENYRYTIHLDDLTSQWAKLVKGNKHSALFKYVDQLPNSYNKAKQYCQKDNIKQSFDIIYVSNKDII